MKEKRGGREVGSKRGDVFFKVVGPVPIDWFQQGVTVLLPGLDAS